MQVTCGQCAAQYEFDASAIPRDGYDAQCANCGSVFFVAPPAPAADALLSVSCRQCGAIYQFAASAIPPGGYDAQCSQCNAVFFVGAEAAPPQPPAAPAPLVPPTPDADLVSPEVPVLLEHASPTASMLASDDTPVTSDTPPTLPPDAFDGVVERPAPPTDDLLALSAELGEPAADPDSTTPEEDFEAILLRRKRRRRAALGVIGLVALYGVVTYFFVPIVFDRTLGPLLGIKAAIHPAAIPLFEAGRVAMLADTDAAYAQAAIAFDEALRADRKYPAALSLAGLAHVFRGSDIQARGRVILDEGAQAIAKLAALDASPTSRRGPQAAAQERELRSKAEQANSESAKLFEAGGKEVTAGQLQLRQALKDFGTDPFVTAAAGIYYGTDPDGRNKANELLRFSIETRLGVGKKLDPKAPPDMWTAFLGASIRADDERELSAAVELYEAALRVEPRFTRARYDLALVQQKLGNRDQSRALAEQILRDVPGHEKATALLATLRQGATPPAEIAPPDSKPPPASARKAGKRRGRGGR